ncbi:MAG: hypothetical protein ACREK6_05195 [Candidatus Rokuibacteriota bacterium]
MPAQAPGVGLAAAPSLAHAIVPRVWQGIGYRPLSDGATARPLFDFAALPWPEPARLALAWGAFVANPSEGERLVGAVLAEREGRAMFLHGPVVVAGEQPLEIAAQLVTAALDHGTALGADVIFTRPQGLDRVWIRFGFIPVPESTLPGSLTGRAGVGLYAWRGGSALWTLREPPRE